MKEKVITGKELLPAVLRRFEEMSGCSRETLAWKNIEKTEYNLLNTVFKNAEVRFRLASFNAEVNEDNKISFSHFNYLLPLSEPGEIGKIKKAAVYLMTLSGIEDKHCHPFEQVCSDLLGTAFSDSAMEYIAEEAGEKGKWFVSPSLGPGYYGLPIGDMIEIYSEMKGSELGVSINENGMLFPEKSRAGFFILSEEPVEFINQCKECRGQKQGCSLCNVRGK